MILAFDLGTTTGWAAHGLPGYPSGTLKLKGGRFEGGGMRFFRFGNQLDALVDMYGRPDLVAFEEVRRHLGTDAAHVYGGMLAVLTSFCEARSIPYAGIPVAHVKQAATGKGNAKKDAMLAAAKLKWPGREFTDDNEVDARWVAEAAAKRLA